MYKDTPCFMEFEEYFSKTYGETLVIGSDYEVDEYGLVTFKGAYKDFLNKESRVWAMAWNAATKCYKDFR